MRIFIPAKKISFGILIVRIDREEMILVKNQEVVLSSCALSGWYSQPIVLTHKSLHSAIILSTRKKSFFSTSRLKIRLSQTRCWLPGVIGSVCSSTIYDIEEQNYSPTEYKQAFEHKTIPCACTVQ